MEAVGARRVLQPLLYVGAAIGVHLLLFLVPVRLGPGTATETTRGLRVQVVKEGPPPDAARTPQGPRPATPPESAPPVSAAGGGSGTAAQSTPRGGGNSGEGAGPAQVGSGPGGAVGESPFDSYLARLRSEGVQGWARDSAGRARQEWKGSGKTGAGWGAGPGSGGKGTGKGEGGGYLDPRVRMVVTSYPPTGIERRYSQVPYPDLKVKQHQATAGWWNVYVQLYTDGEGKVIRRSVLRPETDGPTERMFVAQVQKEIDRWIFDRTEAEILVDVRFHVE